MSNHDEIIKACQEITINKLLDGERVKCQLRTIHEDLTNWACHRAVCTNDEIWDIIERLHQLGKE